MQTIDKVRDAVIEHGVEDALYLVPIDSIEDEKLRQLWSQAIAADMDYIEAVQEVETYLYEQ